MFLVGIIRWWYGDGWKGQWRRVGHRLAATAGFFSIGQLLRTFFAPFRQDSAGGVEGPVGLQIRAFFDKTISRAIGAAVRLFTIIAGAVALVALLTFELFVVLMWLLLPLLPIAGLLLFAIGWVPQWR